MVITDLITSIIPTLTIMNQDEAAACLVIRELGSHPGASHQPVGHKGNKTGLL